MPKQIACSAYLKHWLDRLTNDRIWQLIAMWEGAVTIWADDRVMQTQSLYFGGCLTVMSQRHTMLKMLFIHLSRCFTCTCVGGKSRAVDFLEGISDRAATVSCIVTSLSDSNLIANGVKPCNVYMKWIKPPDHLVLAVLEVSRLHIPQRSPLHNLNWLRMLERPHSTCIRAFENWLETSIPSFCDYMVCDLCKEISQRMEWVNLPVWLTRL